MFFTYGQNNTGGDFIVEVDKGIAEWVIVEADNSVEANERAEDIGIYFHGCSYGKDCSCCGDRWSEIYEEEEGTEEPKIYDESPEKYKKSMYGRKKTVVVHYKNGETKVF